MIKKILNRVGGKLTRFQEARVYKKFINNNNLYRADKIFTHLTKQEKRQLFTLAKEVRNGYALEIGSFIGASANFIATGLDNNSKLICIDTWENDAMTEGKRDTQKEFDANIEIFKEKIKKVQGYSTDVKDNVLSITPKIDMLFIDGDHSYEGCKSDWDLYIDMLKSGGCVIFHDSGWADGVKKVIEENAKPLMSNYDFLPNMFWGYIK